MAFFFQCGIFKIQERIKKRKWQMDEGKGRREKIFNQICFLTKRRRRWGI